MGVFTKKQKKKFNSLDEEAKKEFAKLLFSGEFKKIMGRNAGHLFSDGMFFQDSHLYKKFVREIDSGELSDEERQATIEALLSAIRMGHLHYVKDHGKEAEE